MSGIGDFFKKATFGIFGGSGRKRKPSEVPTIDDAMKQRFEQDRIRRRRGNLANIFGGFLSGAPVTAGKALLGE